MSPIDSDNDWTQAAVVDAHTHMGWVYDYFFKAHRYQGLNNRNATVIGVVNTRALLTRCLFHLRHRSDPTAEAACSSERVSSGPLTVLDVTGHELMHGVTSFSVSQRTGRRFGPTVATELGPSTVVLNGQTFPCTVLDHRGTTVFRAVAGDT